MQLRGLELYANIRITQDTNLFDVKLKLDTSAASMDTNFYAALFFDMLAGNITGADGGTATTGLKFKIYKTDNTEFCVSAAAGGKFDWYETETTFVSEASVTIAAQTVVADTWIKEVELIYVANDAAAPKDIIIMSSTALASTPLSTMDEQATPVKGLKLETAGGNAAITAMLQFSMAK